MSQDLKIKEDWERESLKDLVYLQETQHLLEQEIQRELRQPAQIVVIDTDKILEKDNEPHTNVLPF